MSPTTKFANGFFVITPASTAFSQANFNSSIDEIMICSVLSSDVQIGIGIPQKRERDKFQSLTFSNHFPKRPDPVDSGFQLMVLFNSIMRFFTREARINQESNG